MASRYEAELIEGVLERFAQYLDMLASHVFDVEETIGSSVSTGEESSDSMIKNLQVLDFLRQSLEDLALMTAALGNPNFRPIDQDSIRAISNKLRLKSTRGLLIEDQVKTIDTVGSDIGDLDLF